MPGWLTEVLKLFGFTTPFIYAAATYGFFHWLDKKASGPAKKAISGWLVPKTYDKAAVAAATVEMFDRVYTRPLLAWRAFFRSAIITIGVIILLLYEYPPSSLPVMVFFTTLTNIISDYLGLFVIRRMLVSQRLSPFRAMFFGPLAGIGIVAIIYLTAGYLAYELSYMDLIKIPDERWDAPLGIGALLVHLWLPFFALCVGLLKGLNYFLLAAHRAQWFLKRGKDHPLEVIGFVAAPLIFLGVVAVQLLVSK